jgi:hypothetical protein
VPQVGPSTAAHQCSSARPRAIAPGALSRSTTTSVGGASLSCRSGLRRCGRRGVEATVSQWLPVLQLLMRGLGLQLPSCIKHLKSEGRGGSRVVHAFLAMVFPSPHPKPRSNPILTNAGQAAKERKAAGPAFEGAAAAAAGGAMDG